MKQLAIYYLCAFSFTNETAIFLHFFQQEEYDNQRFLTFVCSRLIDRKTTASLVAVAVIINSFFTCSALPIYLKHIAAGVVFLAFACIQYDPCTKAKKPLVWTIRVKRIFMMACVLSSILIPVLSI